MLQSAISAGEGRNSSRKIGILMCWHFLLLFKNKTKAIPYIGDAKYEFPKTKHGIFFGGTISFLTQIFCVSRHPISRTILGKAGTAKTISYIKYFSLNRLS